jgi:hypothetical protein
VKLIFSGGDGGGGTFACQKNNYGCLNYLSSFQSGKTKKKKKNDVEILSLRVQMWFCNSALNTFFLTMHGPRNFWFGVSTCASSSSSSSSYMIWIEEWN